MARHALVAASAKLCSLERMSDALVSSLILLSLRVTAPRYAHRIML